jgi:HEAT repeat protein
MPFSLICALALEAPPLAPPPAVAGLTHELASPNTITRSRAARELGKLQEQAAAAVPDLVRALADADPFVARDASEALGKIGPAAVPALRGALHSAEPRVRIRALQALSKCCPKDHGTVVAIARMLTEDPDANVRRWAALTLDRIGLTGQGVIANLTAAIADQDVTVRYSAAIALTKYGVEVKETTGQLTPAVLSLIAGLQGATTDVLRAIAETFGTTENPPTREQPR